MTKTIQNNIKIQKWIEILDKIWKYKPTKEKTAANMAPRCTFMYLLLCNIGFWYHGIFTDFIERDFCECKLDKDLKNIIEKNPIVNEKLHWIWRHTFQPNESTLLIVCMMWLGFFFHTWWIRNDELQWTI